jgi:hypothetical protein
MQTQTRHRREQAVVRLTGPEARALRDSIVAVIASRGWVRIALDLDDAHLDRLRAVLNRVEANGVAAP